MKPSFQKHTQKGCAFVALLGYAPRNDTPSRAFSGDTSHRGDTCHSRGHTLFKAVPSIAGTTLGLLLLLLVTVVFLLPGNGLVAEEVASGARTMSSPFIVSPPVLTLQDCLDIALRENRILNQSKAKVKSAKARKDQVKATQLPVASALLQNAQLSKPSSTAADSQDTRRVSITENLQPFGKFQAQKRATEASIRAAEAEASRNEIDVAFQVTRGFYDFILAEQLRKVASESVDQLTHHRQNTKALVEAGSAPRFDLIRAEVQLSSAMPPLIRATHAITDSLADLLNLIGLDPTGFSKIDGELPESIPASIPLDESEALRIAVDHRPDLKNARALAETAKQNLTVTRRNLQPSVQLSHVIDDIRGTRAPLNNYHLGHTTQLGLVFPFFDSGLSRAQTREAVANLEQAKLNQESTLSTLHVEVRKAISGLTESFEVLKSQEKNVEQAQEALNIAEKAYQTGAKTSLDVLDAQVALTQARTLRFQALRDRAVSLAQYEKALGLMPGTFLLQETEAQVPATDGQSPLRGRAPGVDPKSATDGTLLKGVPATDDTLLEGASSAASLATPQQSDGGPLPTSSGSVTLSSVKGE